MSYVKIFSRKELSNEDYHKETEHVSGSQLFKLYSTCPAKFKFGGKFDDEGNEAITSSRALEFGSCAHTNLLEADVFNAEYMRQTVKSDCEGLGVIPTIDAAKKWLKSKGVSGYTTKGADELWEMIVAAKTPKDNVNGLLPVIEAQESKIAEEKRVNLIRGDDYDACKKMREVLFSNAGLVEFLGSGEAEVSCFAVIDDVPVKVRWDYIFNWNVLDYKTTRDAKPEEFGRQAFNSGYYLKMALQHDVFEVAFGRKPDAVYLLAQEKKPPYLAVKNRMVDEQLMIGRMQYRAALQLYKACSSHDVWPAYGGGKDIELQTPAFVKNMYKEIFQ